AADHAERVRVVREEPRVMMRGELRETRQRREIAVHAEDALGHDQTVPMRVPVLLEDRGGMLRVVVAERLDARAAQRRAAREARMTELVDDDQIARACEHGQDAEIREVAASEHDGGLGAFERSEPRLQLLEERMVTRDETRRAGSRAVAPREIGRRIDDARVGCEPEIVVARERDELTAVAPRPRVRTARGLREATAEMTGFERSQLLGRERVER